MSELLEIENIHQKLYMGYCQIVFKIFLRELLSDVPREAIQTTGKKSTTAI